MRQLTTHEDTLLFPRDWLDDEIDSVLREEQDCLHRQQKAEAVGEYHD